MFNIFYYFNILMLEIKNNKNIFFIRFLIEKQYLTHVY
jgi:hypothetical protein